MKLKNLNHIEQYIKQYPLVLLLIKAPHCGVCVAVENQINTFFHSTENTIFIQTDIADIPEMASRFHALTAPVVLLFYQQKEVERFARFVPMDTLQDKLSFWQTQLAQDYSQTAK